MLCTLVQLLTRLLARSVVCLLLPNRFLTGRLARWLSACLLHRSLACLLVCLFLRVHLLPRSLAGFLTICSGVRLLACQITCTLAALLAGPARFLCLFYFASLQFNHIPLLCCAWVRFALLHYASPARMHYASPCYFLALRRVR